MGSKSNTTTGSGSGKRVKQSSYKTARPLSADSSISGNATHIADIKTRRAKQKLNQKVK